MRDVFPPEKHAIAVYPLNNWGGLESQRLKRRVLKSQSTMVSAASRLAATKSIRRTRAMRISLCMALVIIWTNSQEYKRSSRKEQYELCSQHTLVTRIPSGCKSAVISAASNWLTRTSCPIADSGRVFKSNCSFAF